MTVHNNGDVRPVPGPRPDAGGGKPPTGASPGPGSSRVEVSETARELASLARWVREAPDVRQELVASLRERIQSGQYRVDLQGLADRLSRVI